MSEKDGPDPDDQETDQAVPGWKMKGGEYDEDTWGPRPGVDSSSQKGESSTNLATIIGLVVGVLFISIAIIYVRDAASSRAGSEIAVAISMAVSSFIVSLGTFAVVSGMAVDKVMTD